MVLLRRHASSLTSNSLATINLTPEIGITAFARRNSFQHCGGDTIVEIIRGKVVGAAHGDRGFGVGREVLNLSRIWSVDEDEKARKRAKNGKVTKRRRSGGDQVAMSATET